VFDFNQRKPIGKNIIDLPKGYDLNYVLDINNDIAAQVYHQESGRVMTVKTTEPGLQFYSANFPFPLHQKSSKEPELFSSFCLEAQHFPNSPNEPSFPSTMLNPGEVYQQHTAYVFSIK
jgi:aldose 1-epimerase